MLLHGASGLALPHNLKSVSASVKLTVGSYQVFFDFVQTRSMFLPSNYRFLCFAG